MSKQKILILDKERINRKLQRMAYEIWEHNSNETHITLLGVQGSGLAVANNLAARLGKISPLKVEVVTISLNKKNPLAKKIGLLSTHSTHLSGLYQGPLQDRGFEVVSPTEKDFKVFINPAIDQVKANQIIPAEKTFTIVAQSLIERGAEVIILGCTEIPVVMKKQLTEKPSMYIDSNQALAQAVIDFFQNTKASAPQIV